MKQKLDFEGIVNSFPSNSLLNKEKMLNMRKNATEVFVSQDYERFNAYELDFPFSFDEIEKALDTDNSNIYIWSIFTFQKVKFKLGPALIASISYNGFSFPLFCIVKNISESEVVKINYIIDFYSSYFVIKNQCDDLVILEELDFIYCCVSNLKRTRYDLAFDYCYDELSKCPSMSSLINMRTGTDFKLYFDGGVNNSWSYGKKNNKRIFVRCYDKKLDSLKKGKAILFPYVNDYTSVYRLEFQFGPNSFFCKNDCDISDYEKQKLRNAYLGKYGINFELKLQYRKKILGYAKRIYGAGLDLEEFFNDIVKTCGRDDLIVKIINNGGDTV